MARQVKKLQKKTIDDSEKYDIVLKATPADLLFGLACRAVGDRIFMGGGEIGNLRFRPRL